MMGENKAYTYSRQLFSFCVLRKLPKNCSGNNLKRGKQHKCVALATKLKTATTQKQMQKKEKPWQKYNKVNENDTNKR